MVSSYTYTHTVGRKIIQVEAQQPQQQSYSYPVSKTASSETINRAFDTVPFSRYIYIYVCAYIISGSDGRRQRLCGRDFERSSYPHTRVYICISGTNLARSRGRTSGAANYRGLPAARVGYYYHRHRCRRHRSYRTRALVPLPRARDKAHARA